LLATTFSTPVLATLDAVDQPSEMHEVRAMARSRIWAVVGGVVSALLISGAAQLPAGAAGNDEGSTSDESSTSDEGFTIATWNIGRGTYADARRVLSESSVLALQEASDKGQLIDRLKRDGYRVIRGSGKPGQSATPFVFDPKALQLVRPVVALMAPRQRIGRGTGPDTMKAKWLIGGRFVERATGRHLFIGTTHLVAGQNHPRRARVALRHVRNAVSELRRLGGTTFLMGDFNTRPHSKVTGPLRATGWTSDQIVGQRLGTHGGWSPDQVWWNRSSGIELVEHHTISNRSDHDALVTTVTLR
jgi:hypothetical protein